MGKGLPYSSKRGKAETQEIIKQRIAFTGKSISVAGTSGVGWGTVVIGDLPEGNVLFLGAIAYVTFTGPTSASLGDTWNGDWAIGTAPTGDATLNGSEVNLIPSTPTVVAVSEVSTGNRGISTTTETGAILDNTDGSLEFNLNLLVDDADISGTVAITAAGFLEIAYIMMGDD